MPDEATARARRPDRSRLGLHWRSVDTECKWPTGRDPAGLRVAAAAYYGVPLRQVAEPQPITSTEPKEISDAQER